MDECSKVQSAAAQAKCCLAEMDKINQQLTKNLKQKKIKKEKQAAIDRFETAKVNTALFGVGGAVACVGAVGITLVEPLMAPLVPAACGGWIILTAVSLEEVYSSSDLPK